MGKSNNNKVFVGASKVAKLESRIDNLEISTKLLNRMRVPSDDNSPISLSSISLENTPVKLNNVIYSEQDESLLFMFKKVGRLSTMYGVNMNKEELFERLNDLKDFCDKHTGDSMNAEVASWNMEQFYLAAAISDVADELGVSKQKGGLKEDLVEKLQGNDFNFDALRRALDIQ